MSMLETETPLDIKPNEKLPLLEQEGAEVKFRKLEFNEGQSRKVVELLVELPPERNEDLEPFRQILDNYELPEEQRRTARETLGQKGQKYCNNVGLIRREIRSTFTNLPKEKIEDACTSITELVINAIIHSHDNTVKITISSDGTITLESANLFDDARKQIPQLTESNQRLKDNQRPIKPESDMTEEEKQIRFEQEREESAKPGGRGLAVVIGSTDQIIYDVDTGHGTGQMELHYNSPNQPEAVIFKNHGQEIGHLLRLEEKDLEKAA